MVGASGALYGVLVGFAMLFPNAQLMLLFPPIPVKAKILVPILILADLFFGFDKCGLFQKFNPGTNPSRVGLPCEIGRASCRERV